MGKNIKSKKVRCKCCGRLWSGKKRVVHKKSKLKKLIQAYDKKL